MKLACDQYYIDSERNPTGGIVGRTPNNERRYVNMAVTGIGTYASYTNSYDNTQNAGNKTGRTYKNAFFYSVSSSFFHLSFFPHCKSKPIHVIVRAMFSS